MVERIALLGIGSIGREFLRQVFENDTDQSIHVNYSQLIFICSSKRYLYSESGLSAEECSNFISNKSGAGRPYSGLQELFDLFKAMKEPVRIVDATTSGKDMLSFQLRIIKETQHTLVTANKYPLAEGTFREFALLTESLDRYGFSASVMAGAPGVEFIRRRRAILNEDPTKVEIHGCLSGTLAYVTAKIFDEGARFSDAVRDALKKGFTESNPAQDLSGLDVATKIIILARSAGTDVGMKDVKLTPFLPPTSYFKDSSQAYLRSSGVEELFAKLEMADEAFSGYFSDLKSRSLVPRYVARLSFRGKHPTVSAGLEELQPDDPLARLKSLSNRIYVKTQYYSEPIEFGGPGAGPDITASNIRLDLGDQIHSPRQLRESE